MVVPSSFLSLKHFVDRIPMPAVCKIGEKLVPNQGVMDLTGFGIEELCCLDQWMKRLFPENWLEVRELYDKDRNEGFPRPSLVKLCTKSGRIRWVEFSGYLDGELEVWLMKDLTTGKEAEQKLIDLRSRFEKQEEDLARVLNMLFATRAEVNLLLAEKEKLARVLQVEPALLSEVLGGDRETIVRFLKRATSG